MLGFSKGPNASVASLANESHNSIAYKGKRANIGKILAHVGLHKKGDNIFYNNVVDKAIADINGRFHFGSLIRCGVERKDVKTGKWKGCNANMLDKFVASDFGKKVSQECSSRFLGDLPPKTKLVIMFGMGTNQNYVLEAYKLFQHARPGDWHWLEKNVSYTDNKITVVHVEHFGVLGRHLKDWLGENTHKRSALGEAARLSVEIALK